MRKASARCLLVSSVCVVAAGFGGGFLCGSRFRTGDASRHAAGDAPAGAAADPFPSDAGGAVLEKALAPPARAGGLPGPDDGPGRCPARLDRGPAPLPSLARPAPAEAPAGDPTDAASAAAVLAAPMPQHNHPVPYYRVTLPDPFPERKPLLLPAPAEDTGLCAPASYRPAP
jgi:hypothetical protein